jgi:CarboxypepD_reg-like domain
LIFILVIHQTATGQKTEKNKLLQVSGIITDDENKPVPHVSIISKKLRRGTISEMTGIYSLISMTDDTVLISALGYKLFTFRVPSDFDGKIYKKDISLVSDTISIGGVTIFPWRNYEEFKRDVLANQPVMKPEIRYMYENLANIQYAIANNPNYSVSPEAGYRMAMQQHVNSYVTKNQSPPNNLLNPFAWAKFFQGVKHGLLKNQKSPETTKTSNKKKKKKSTTG